MLKICSLLFTCAISSLLFTGCVKEDKLKELIVKDIDCGVHLSEASGLAYIEKEKKLYIVGDKGKLYTCGAELTQDTITLKYEKELYVQHNFGSIDIEGLDVMPDGQLIVSIEGSSSGIYKMSKDGVIKEAYSLPKVLKTANFTSNRTLETVVHHPDYGILTASEFPINNQTLSAQTIYSLDGKNKWNFDMENWDLNGITSLEVDTDGNLLVLERSQPKSGFLRTSIVKVDIKNCANKTKCDKKVLFDADTAFSNFEGMTNIKEKNFLRVNDNQGIKDIKTEFKYFQIEEIVIDPSKLK